MTTGILPRVKATTGIGASETAFQGMAVHRTAEDSFPQADLSNGIIHARFYLPDTSKGYYRGSRFDWSGVMPVLEYKGHSYSGLWFEHYAPTIHDAIMGPVESFDPIGYERAGPTGGFVAIGIGVLARSGEAAYSPFHYYNVLNPGEWKVKKSSDKLAFTQTLQDTVCSYVYEKTLQLTKGKPRLVIRHRLKNTGQQTIETNVYDHNLLLLDHQPVGPGLVFSFPFNLTGTEERRIGTVADIRDRQISFLQKPVKHEDVYAVLGGYGKGAGDYDIKMENRHTGAGVRITSDRPLSKLVFWGSSTIACPEPYIHVKVAPGDVFTWDITYEFYEFSTDHP
jgi:hypothetical protein